MTNPAHTVAADVAIISAGMAAHRAALRHAERVSSSRATSTAPLVLAWAACVGDRAGL